MSAADEPPLYAPVRITNDSLAARNTRVELDGRDISRWVSRYEVVGAYKDATMLRLELLVAPVVIEEPTSVGVELDRSLEALLIHKGWTPPGSTP